MSEKPGVTLSEWLILFFAGPQLGEAIAGDLEEQAVSARHSQWVYEISVLRSLPGLVRLGWSNASSTRLSSEIGFSVLAVLFVWMWEIWVARIFAWPIASNIYAFSPLSVAATCKLVYLGLFALGTGFLLSGLSVLSALTNQSWRVRVHRFATWGMAGLTPCIYLIVNPGPFDGGALFRYVQIALIVLVGSAAILVGRSNFRPANNATRASA
ncbi:MAG: hypothetical protein ABJH52_06275 [Henriciella sp.]